MFFAFQSPELEYRHDLMGRLNKLDTDVELEIIQHQPDHSPNSAGVGVSSISGLSCGGYTNSHIYDSYGKEYYFGNFTMIAP